MANQITGTNNADTLQGTTDSDNVELLAGADFFTDSERGNDTVNGGSGNDSITVDNGDNYLIGGDGNDTIRSGFGYFPGNDTVTGGNGNDVITAQSGDSSLLGGNGADLITSISGNNYLEGGSGNDVVTSGSGNDTIDGGEGNDQLNAGTGINYIQSGSGADIINIKTGINIINAGNTDTISSAAGADSFTHIQITEGTANTNIWLNPTNGNNFVVNGEGASGDKVTLTGIGTAEVTEYGDFAKVKADGSTILLRNVDYLDYYQAGNLTSKTLGGGNEADAHVYEAPEVLEINSLSELSQSLNNNSFFYGIKADDPESLLKTNRSDLTVNIDWNYNSNKSVQANGSSNFVLSQNSGIVNIGGEINSGAIEGNINDISIMSSSGGHGIYNLVNRLIADSAAKQGNNSATESTEYIGLSLQDAHVHEFEDKGVRRVIGQDSTRASNQAPRENIDFYNVVYKLSDDFWKDFAETSKAIDPAQISTPRFEWDNNNIEPTLDLNSNWDKTPANNYKGLDLKMSVDKLAVYDLGYFDGNGATHSNDIWVRFKHDNSGQLITFKPFSHDSDSLIGSRGDAYSINRDESGEVTGTDIELRIAPDTAAAWTDPNFGNKDLAHKLQLAYKSDLLEYINKNGTSNGFDGESNWKLENVNFANPVGTSTIVSNLQQGFGFTIHPGVGQNQESLPDFTFTTKPLYGLGEVIPGVVNEESKALISVAESIDQLIVDPSPSTALSNASSVEYTGPITSKTLGDTNIALNYELIGFKSDLANSFTSITQQQWQDSIGNKHNPAHFFHYYEDPEGDFLGFDTAQLNLAYNTSKSALDTLISSSPNLGLSPNSTAVWGLRNLNLNSQILDNHATLTFNRPKTYHNSIDILNQTPSSLDFNPWITATGDFTDYKWNELIPDLDKLSTIELKDVALGATSSFAHPSPSTDRFEITSAYLRSGQKETNFQGLKLVNGEIKFDQRHSDLSGGDYLNLGYSLKGDDLTGNPGGNANIIGVEGAGLTNVAVLGPNTQTNNSYVLEITAESLKKDWKLESADIVLQYNSDIFKEINLEDIEIANELPIKKSVAIDDKNGLIRFAAASLGALGEGSSLSDENLFASIKVDFDESYFDHIDRNPDVNGKFTFDGNPLGFKLIANSDETIFSRTFSSNADGKQDATGTYTNREIKSLGDLKGKTTFDQSDVNLYQAEIKFEEKKGGLTFGTQRVIGSNQGFTNLIREGDTVTAQTTIENIGNSLAKNLVVYNAGNVANAKFLESRFLEKVSNGQNISINANDKVDLSGGVFADDFSYDKSKQESVNIEIDMQITGKAGSVVDVTQGLFKVSASGMEQNPTFTPNHYLSQKGSKNLITFGGDLNYDGRVSMKDLAYLNAGAARQVKSNDGSIVTESVAGDVDANFDNKIDINDLAVLDADWGQTLHDGDQNFVGSSDKLNWTMLDNQGDTTWDNTSFKEQNSIEAETGFIQSLEAPTDAGMIGSESASAVQDSGEDSGNTTENPL